MTERARHVVFLIGAVGIASVLVPALLELARAGGFADLIADHYLEHAVRETHSYNVVSSVIFDYRGFDTMFEQLILFAAVVGVTLLLRIQSDEIERSPQESLALVLQIHKRTGSLDPSSLRSLRG